VPPSPVPLPVSRPLSAAVLAAAAGNLGDEPWARILDEAWRAAIFLGVPLLVLLGVMCLLLAYALTHPPRVTAGVAAARGWWIDPGDAELEFEEWTLDRPDGTRLPVWDVPLPTAPQGPIVIISHCWGGSRIESLQRLPFIQDEASRVILWDQRAHGEAAGSGVSTLGTREVSDLLDLIDRVAHDGRPVVLYGYSMGAGISIVAASRDDRVIGVIADGPYRWTGEPVNSILRINGIPLFPITNVVHRWLCLRFDGLRGSDRARFASDLRCPLLVLHGTHDAVTSIESAREIAEAAPEHEFIVMADAAHIDLHIEHPEHYRRALASFIRRSMNRARTRAARPAEESAGTHPPDETPTRPAGHPSAG